MRYLLALLFPALAMAQPLRPGVPRDVPADSAIHRALVSLNENSRDTVLPPVTLTLLFNRDGSAPRDTTTLSAFAAKAVTASRAYRLCLFNFAVLDSFLVWAPAVTADSLRGHVKLLARAHKVREYEITLFGHSSPDGASNENMDLSLARAEWVRSFLRARDVPAEDLSVKSWGGAKPVTRVPSKFHLNRRVVVEAR